MTSYQIPLQPNKKAGSRFVARVREVLQIAVAYEAKHNKINQSKIADRLGVHRSVISRELNGLQDMPLRRVGEICEAIGRIAYFEAKESKHIVGQNSKIDTSSKATSADHLIIKGIGGKTAYNLVQQ